MTGSTRTPPLWPIFALSCGVLGYEIALMRVLLYASWHHFAFLVISVALLGFGASGTVLCFLRDWLIKRSDDAIFFLVLSTALTIPLSLHIAQYIPVEARLVPVLLTRQLSLWVLYWLVLSIPFFLGATTIGLALIMAGPRVTVVYGINLTGSAIGVIAGTGLMFFATPEWLAPSLGAVVLTGLLGATRRKRHVLAAVVTTLGVASLLTLDRPRVRVDPYKYLSYVHRLQKAGDASAVGEAKGPRAVIELFSGTAFHDLPFLAVGESPPRITTIVLDGHLGGSLLHVANPEEARIVDRTLMSVPYEFAGKKPGVLVLGEIGGANIWLALRRNASRIHVVQSNPQLVDLLVRYAGGGTVFEWPGVTIHRTTPRHFVDYSRERFELVQVASMESWAVEAGGIAGLNQDHLVTVEGMTRSLERLTPDGILAVARGLQIPPRDNVKLLNTLTRALERIGAAEPGMHVVMVRDYLAVCTMIKRSPWNAAEIQRVRDVVEARELTPVYFPGIRDDELNHPDELPGPDGGRGDWLHYASTRILSADHESFVDDWAFDIRAPTDDRPFFGNFTKLRSIGEFKQAFGDLWLTRTELALLFVLAAGVVIALAGLLAMVVPLIPIGRIRRSANLGRVTTYFVAIGLAYLMLEITMLSRLMRLIGDPVLGGAATIAGFLFFSGLGSLTAQRMERTERLTVLIAVLIAAGIIDVWLAWRLPAGALPEVGGFVTALLITAPLGFLMGFPMPVALRRLDEQTPALIPWAWGVNGFASVLASPLATAIGMTVGFSLAGVGSLVCYAVAAFVFAFPGRRRL